MDLLVIGDCSIDQYMQVEPSDLLHNKETGEDKICFIHGSKIPVAKFNYTLAGNACHVSIGAQKLGLNVGIYTELGDDDYGETFLKRFEKEGISTKLSHLNENQNTNVHTLIWHAGDRTIFSYHEPRIYKLDFKAMEVPKWLYYTSLAEGFEDFQEEVITWVKEKATIGVGYNPGSIMLKNMEHVHEFLKVTDVLFVNREEASKITGEAFDIDTEPIELHKKLELLGVRMSVITDGGRGASVYDGQQYVKRPAPKIEGVIVDKTGAGDAYAASFISALHHGKSIETAMKWGETNASSIVKILGCIDGLVTLDKMPQK